jgi:hypothetical protein
VPEEIEEIALASKPVALTELLAAIPDAPALERLRRAEHITVGYDVSDGEITALEFRDAGARLLRFERDLIKVLTAGDAAASVTSRSRRRSIPRCPPYGEIAH